MTPRPDAPRRSGRAETVSRPRARWKVGAAAGVLLGLAVLPYLGTLRGGFVSDDDLLLQTVRTTCERAGWPALFGEDLTTFSGGGRTGFYRPLTMLSYRLDQHSYGERPAGYHATNLVLHVLATWLVLALGLQIGLGSRAAAAAAALFAVHPVHVEAVAWIAGRFDVLCTVFYAAALLAFARAHARRSTPWFVASLAAGVAALLSKEMALTLPAAILLLDVLGLSYGRGPRRVVARGLWSEGALGRLWRTLPFVLLVVGFVILRGVLLGTSLGRAHEGRLAGPEFVLTQARALLYYLGQLVVPVRLNSLPILSTVTTLWNPWFLGGLGVAVGLVVLALRWKRRVPVATFGVLFLLASLVPLSNFVPLYPVAGIRFPVAERYLYLVSIGFVLALAALGWEFARRLGARRWTVFAACVAVLVVAGAGRTLARVPVWQSNDALFASMERDDPRNPWAYVMQAERARQLGRLDDARRILDHADRLDLNGFVVALERGELELQAGNATDALPWLEKAVAAKADSRDARLAYAKALRRTGRLPEAAQQYAVLVAQAPRDAEALVNQGELLLASGQVDAAQRNFATAAEFDPRRKEAFYNLGVVAIRQGNLDVAEHHARGALAVDPHYADGHLLLGNIAAQRQEFAIAATEFEQAAALDTTSVQARVNLGAALLDLGEFPRAISVLEDAVRRGPSSRAWLNLANAQSRGGVPAAAEHSFREALRLQPDFELARRGLGLLLAGQPGRADEARTLLAPLHAAHPEDTEVATAWQHIAGRR